MRSSSFLLTSLVVTACGSPDISGIYQTQSAAFDRGTCEAKTTTTTPAFFVVRAGELFGAEFYTVRACASADLASCDNASGPDTISGSPLAVGSGSGWEGSATSAGGFGDSCTYSAAQVTATVGDDATILTVVASVKRGERMGVSSCEADDVPADLPCEEAQSVTGKKVADVPPSEGLAL